VHLQVEVSGKVGFVKYRSKENSGQCISYGFQIDARASEHAGIRFHAAGVLGSRKRHLMPASRDDQLINGHGAHFRSNDQPEALCEQQLEPLTNTISKYLARYDRGAGPWFLR